MMSIDVFIFIIFAQNLFAVTNGFLYFPSPTNLQITCGISSPIETKPRKIFISNGLQFNYLLPHRPEDFEHPKYVQNYPNSRSFHIDGNSSIAMVNKPKRNIVETGIVNNDVTAGQLYKTITDGITSLKFGEECLLKSICHLARHPFHFDENENLLAEVIAFLLTPSLHRGFAENEHEQQSIYETAEFNGRRGVDCNQIYVKCNVSILDYISVLED